MSSSYGTDESATPHDATRSARPAFALALPAAVALGVVAAVSLRRHDLPTVTAAVLVTGTCVLVAVVRRAGGAALVVALAAVGGVVGVRAWDGVSAGATSPVDTRATVMSDPVRRSGALDVVLEIDGRRYQAWLRGSSARRLERALMGDTVRIVGTTEVPTPLPGWYVARHVVGDVEVSDVGSVRPGAPVQLAANRVRRQLDHGARSLPDADRALFAGLVFGDDRAVAPEVVDRFRAAGLSHLTAVSGQNVAYLLAAVSPVLRRLSPWGRWWVTLALIAWFALLTRFEPSVVRASAMAVVGATAFVTGRERTGVGLLATALTALLIVDPLLVWSIGLWLSAGATAGLALLAAPIERAVPGPRWLARPFAAAAAAQIGVLPVSTAVFGVPSVVSLPANLLAVPVAGAVMLAGFPVALAASVLPDAVAAVVQMPCLAGVRWVTLIARLGAAAAPPAPVSAAVWLTIAVVVGRRMRHAGVRVRNDP